MTTGSIVETIDAVPGPSARMPHSSATIPATVEPHDSARIHSQPLGSKSSDSEPVPAPTAVIETAAPVTIRPDRTNGSTAPTMRSLTRMYPA